MEKHRTPVLLLLFVEVEDEANTAKGEAAAAAAALDSVLPGWLSERSRSSSRSRARRRSGIQFNLASSRSKKRRSGSTAAAAAAAAARRSARIWLTNTGSRCHICLFVRLVGSVTASCKQQARATNVERRKSPRLLGAMASGHRDGAEEPANGNGSGSSSSHHGSGSAKLLVENVAAVIAAASKELSKADLPLLFSLLTEESAFIARRMMREVERPATSYRDAVIGRLVAAAATTATTTRATIESRNWVKVNGPPMVTASGGVEAANTAVNMMVGRLRYQQHGSDINSESRS